MRLETTMSLSGPVPRSHSPLDWVRLSRFIGGFPLTNRIAEPSGLFIGLRLDSSPELLAELAELGLGGGVPQGIDRHLALVLGGAVDALQERQERRPKHHVVVRTTEPTFCLELHILYAALRAVQPRQLVGRRADMLADH